MNGTTGPAGSDDETSRSFHDAFMAVTGAVDTVAVGEVRREYQVHPGDLLGTQAEVVATESLSDLTGPVEFEPNVFASREDRTVTTMPVCVAVRRRPTSSRAVE